MSEVTYAEVVEQRKNHLERKAERFSTFSEHAAERSEEHWRKSDLSYIPMGQPILIGHHSQKRHENAIARSNAHSMKSIDEQKKAEKWEHRAEHAENLLVKMEESIPYMSGKMEQAETEVRLWTQRHEKSRIFIQLYETGKLTEYLASACGFSPSAIDSARQDNGRSIRELAQAQEKRDYWRAKIDSLGGLFDPSALKKGDMIETTQGKFPVHSINKKTVTISNWMGIPTNTFKIPFSHIKGKVI